MKASCPNCGQHIMGEDAWAGMTVPCPNCGTQFQLPASASPPPVPPPPPPTVQSAPPRPQSSPGSAPSATIAPPVPGPSKAVDAVAYVILFIPALLVWQAVGGIFGLFLGALILFLFRAVLARLIQMGLDNLGSFKELLPALGVLLLVVLLAVLLIWKPWGAGYYYTLSNSSSGIHGPEARLTVRDSKGKELVSTQVGTARGYNQNSKVSVGGELVLTVEARNGRPTKVVYKGSTLKERQPPKKD